jgi:hypothetical protein
MDLLSTVLHELGNTMGFAEDHGRDVTGMVLPAGERRVPAAEPHLNGQDVSQPAALASSNGFALLPAPAGAQFASISPDAFAVEKLTTATAAFAGAASVSSVVAPNATAGSQSTSGTVTRDDVGGSFVSLTGGPPGRHTAAAADVDTPPPERHSSRPSDRGDAAPIAINWDNRIGAVAEVASGPSAGSREWLDDFLNHLGQNETQRNPNAGLRVHPTPPAVHVAG